MDERIERVLNYIESHIYDSLSLSELANIACLTPFHFHRLFKQETGLTTKIFVDSLKMEKALHEVVYSFKPVAEIAIQFGYNDYETFSRRFKKYHQVSPDDLRSILKNLMQQNQSLNNQVIVLTHTSDNLDEISEKLAQKIKINDYNPLKDDEVITFMVHKKSLTENSANKSTIQIKNKYQAEQTNELWKKVLEKYVKLK
ncbi:MAG: AraC family transcriptional regulator [Flavobacteriales bacterium]|nr:AraC family transcriptional regulator [Flavobacteriales bacterium]